MSQGSNGENDEGLGSIRSDSSLEIDDSGEFSIVINELVTVSDGRVKEALEKKTEHVYEQFVRPMVDEKDEGDTLQAVEVMNELSPCYSYQVVERALNYGADQGELQTLEEDKGLFLYSP